MIDFKLTLVHRALDRNETIRFLFMLVVVMGFIVPITLVQNTRNPWGLIAVLPSLYITLTRMYYIHSGGR